MQYTYSVHLLLPLLAGKHLLLLRIPATFANSEH